MTDSKKDQLHNALTNWITHSSCQLPAVCVTRHELLQDWSPTQWDPMGTFDVAIGMHLIDLTQLFMYDAPKSLLEEMASEDRAIRWQRMQLTAAAIVTTLRGMRYEGGGGELERLATASLVETRRKNLGSELFTQYLAQRRREQATLDHRRAFPHTKLYTNSLSKHHTLDGMQRLKAGTETMEFAAEHVHSNPSVRHTVPESDGNVWSRVASTELLALLDANPNEMLDKINNHPLFSSSLTDGQRDHLRAQISERAIDEDATHPERFKEAHTLLFVPLQEGIPFELSMLTTNDVLSYVDTKQIPVLAVKCDSLGTVENLWLCVDPGAAISSLVLTHAEHVELCSCALV